MITKTNSMAASIQISRSIQISWAAKCNQTAMAKSRMTKMATIRVTACSVVATGTSTMNKSKNSQKNKMSTLTMQVISDIYQLIM